eukprot:6155698-Lingulodinium_polyedra.AAC.1
MTITRANDTCCWLPALARGRTCCGLHALRRTRGTVDVSERWNSKPNALDGLEPERARRASKTRPKSKTARRPSKR